MSQTHPPNTRDTRGPIVVTAIGMLLLQAVWILAVPPFRGIDEFDHAYKAAAVARGQWQASPEAATRGTGAWLEVPSDLVDAATAECQERPYTSDDDCVGEDLGDGVTRVASGAGRYHPAFYAVIGTVALPFDGAAALYAMRATSAVLTWILFVLALVAARTWARGKWALLGLSAAATPVLTYSAAIAAPNGLEMTAGLALWCSLIGLALQRSPRHDAVLLVVTALSGAVLVTVRSLGPLWAGLIALTVVGAFAIRRDQWTRVMLRSRGWVVAALIVGVTSASLLWISRASSLVIGLGGSGTPLTSAERAERVATQLPLWLLQSIAAFPTRGESTHPVVYILYLAIVGVAFAAASVFARGRLRLGIAAAVLVIFAVPGAITYSTLETYGAAWQGRYALPYAVGVLLLVGVAIGDRTVRHEHFVLGLLGTFFVIAHVVGPVLVAHQERGSSPGVSDGSWVLVPLPLLGLMAAMGAAAMWAGPAVWEGARERELGAPSP